MSILRLEKDITSIFQKNLKFRINNKVLKEGKLILFSFKEFYLHFKLCIGTNTFKYLEVPYPFNYQIENDKIVFDYTNRSLTKNNLEIETLIKLLKKQKLSKFYDNKLIIEIV
jgi:hypothetical protein